MLDYQYMAHTYYEVFHYLTLSHGTIPNLCSQNVVWRLKTMAIDKKEWDRFFKLFQAFNKGKLLKAYSYTVAKKNATLGKKLFKEMSYSDNGVIGGLVRKNFLKDGFKNASAYWMTKRSDYVDGDNPLVSSVFNKRKFKGKKSGFHYKGGLKYADKFIYKRFGSPVEKFEKQIKDDYDRGIKKAIEDSMKKGGFK